jgi:hypothetical protein
VTPDDAVVAMLEALERAAVPYMLVGSLASNFHGIPRSTRDADFVIDLPPGGLGRLAGTLEPQLSLMPQTAFETVTGTVRHLIEVVVNPVQRPAATRRRRLRTSGVPRRE